MSEQETSIPYDTLCELMKYAGFSTPETRKSDSLDFKDCSVWSVRRAIESAYEAGLKSKRRLIASK